MKKVAFHNLGCKVNSYELDVMKQDMVESGYEVVPFDEKADVYIINTCTVTNIADRKSRQMLHRSKKLNPDAVVVAVGCYVETDPERVKTDPAIDLAIGNNKKSRIVPLLEEYLKNRDENRGDKTVGGETMDDLLSHPSYEDMQLVHPGHTRAYIKIQDGCNQFCSYCIIPYARGRIRSRRPQEIIREVENLTQRGVREVVLTGIHISSYGLEWDSAGPVRFDPARSGENLLRLMQRLQEIPGLLRIRLGSLEPRIMTDAFIREIARMPKVCPHFHLSLQSGCDETLRRMNRHYSTREFEDSVQLLRENIDRPAITTDVIVGFPGETEEEFSRTVDFLEKIRFYEIHVFKYSVRHGTAAEKMPCQIPAEVKTKRSEVLLSMTKRQARQYRCSFEGQEEEILIEEPVNAGGKLYVTGHTMRYVQGLCAVGSGRTGDIVRGIVRPGPKEYPYVTIESPVKIG